MILLLFIIGLFIGSFLGVVADRIPQDQSIRGRSHCEYCSKTLQPHNLIPVFSYLFQGGKCSYCQKRLSPRYLFIELVTAGLFALPWIIGRPLFLASITPETLLVVSPIFIQTWIILISWLLMASSFIITLATDMRFHIMLDESTGGFLIATLILTYMQQDRLLDPSTNQFVGGVVLMVLLLGFYLLTRGRGMGLGDVKFAFPMGMLLGSLSGLIALYISFIIGGLYSLSILLIGKAYLKQKIAFGPFLIIGTLAVFFYEREIVRLFLGLFT